MTQPNIDETMEALVQKIFVLVKDTVTRANELRTQPDGKNKLREEYIRGASVEKEIRDELMPLIKQHPKSWADCQRRASPQIREMLPGLFST